MVINSEEALKHISELRSQLEIISIERKCRVSGKCDPSSHTIAVNTALCRCTYSSTTHGIVYVDKINTIIIIGLSCILTGYEPNYDTSNCNNKNTKLLINSNNFRRIGD